MITITAESTECLLCDQEHTKQFTWYSNLIILASEGSAHLYYTDFIEKETETKRS